MAQRNAQPLVSVIVPIYNVEKYLARCLDSIVGQTYQNLEIILVNDGSTDGSGEICFQYAQKDPRIRLFNQENRGVSAARNVGLDNMNGEYIVFIDSDDYMSLHFVEILLTKLLEFDVEIAICDWRIVAENENDARMDDAMPVGDPDLCERVSREEVLNPANERIQEIAVSADSKIYKRTVFEEIRYKEEKTCEDLFIFHKLYIQVNEICYVKLKMYAYRYRMNSISKGNGIPHVSMDCIEALLERMAFFQENGMEQYAEGTAGTAFLSYTLLGDYPRNQELRKGMKEFEEQIYSVLGKKPFSLKYTLFKIAPRSYQFLRRSYKRLQFQLRQLKVRPKRNG